MTTIDLTPAELELIQAKRIEAEKVQAENEARLKQEIADRTATYQKSLSGKVTIAKRNLDLMRNNYNAMLTKGTTAWKWSTITKTIEEVVRVYDRTINDYVTHDTLTATIEIATLTNGKVIIECQDNQFVSNIYKERTSRWNRSPKPIISSYTSGRGYTSLKKCIAVAEELMEEMQAIAASKNAHINLQQEAVAALTLQYPTATVAAYTHWDRSCNKDIPMVAVKLHNGVELILNPYTKGTNGIIQYSRHSITYPQMDTLSLVSALNAIAI